MVFSRVLPVLGCAALLSLPARGAGESAPAPAHSNANANPGAPTSLLRQIDEGFVAVFNKVAPAVVVIENTRSARSAEDEADAAGEAYDFFFRSPHSRRQQDNGDGEDGSDDGAATPRRRFRMPAPPERNEGSGFLLRQDGYIVTNNHVVENAGKISVRLRDGRKFEGRVVGTDPLSDIAVIKIDAKGLPVLPLGDSDAVRVGQLVCAIGIPFELDYSFSIGCVSGKGRSGLMNNLTYEDYIQTDALINPGNSGGPLFDVEGNVVGMNTLINGIGRGLAFAIPSNMIRTVTDQLIATGRMRRPALGIRIETLEEGSSLREQIHGIDKGVIVNTIEPDTAAYRSDLRPTDVITAVDGVPVATAHELQKQVLSKKIGQKLSLSVWRSGKMMTIPITAGEMPSGPATAGRDAPPEEGEEGSAENGTIPDLGLRLDEISPKAAKRLNRSGKSGALGALVMGVTPNSPAAAASLQPDDVITEIDYKAVGSAAEARKLLAQGGKGGKKSFLLMVERNGQKTYAILKIEK